jgi:drug/metabolite transporter (DMT)-like permease
MVRCFERGAWIFDHFYSGDCAMNPLQEPNSSPTVLTSGLTGPLLLLLAAAIYGAIFPVNRFAAEVNWPPMSFAFLQSLLAGILLACITVFSSGRFALTFSHVQAYLTIGGLAVGLPMGLLVAAASHLDASVLTLVLCLSPIITLIIGTLLGLEKFDRYTVFGMLIGILGIAIIVVPQTSVLREGTSFWFMLSLGAPIMFAMANNFAKLLRPPETASMTMAAGTLLGAAVVALAVMLAFKEPLIPLVLDGATILPLLAAATINALFYFLFFEIIKRIGPARFSFFNYLAVAAGVLWSMLVFQEKPAGLFWLAIVVMFAGMYTALSRKAA